MMYFCCDDRRRIAVGQHPQLTGIDYLEVEDGQQLLRVHFVPSQHDGKTAVPAGIGKEHVRITGGERVTSIRVLEVTTTGDDLLVRVDDDGQGGNGVGDFSVYTLRLVDQPSVDPLLAEVDFSFKAECPAELDCLAGPVVRCSPGAAPDIDYLAKDYASFRQLMLDRLSALQPGWTERQAADTGVMLVELLAYVADHLSYQQDAVATEAYFGTARRRVSVRRHARLVDYFLHDGSNARTFVHVQANADEVRLEPGTQLLTRVAGQPPRIPLPSTSPALARALEQKPQVFETLHGSLLYRAHNEIPFHTWGNQRCWLPRGATQAFLRDDLDQRLRLRAGDVLVLVERVGPHSGRSEDAALERRHAVRLTRVVPAADVLVEDGIETRRTPAPPVLDPLDNQPYVTIEWSDADALPFALCLSSAATAEHGGMPIPAVSVALGNMVLADHGRSVTETIGPVPSPDPRLTRVAMTATCSCDPDEATRRQERLVTWPRFRPALRLGPLTQAAGVTVARSIDGVHRRIRVPFDPAAPAAAALNWSMDDVLPVIDLNGGDWLPRRDLLASGPLAREFVVETEADGTASLRFGDSVHGLRPVAGMEFAARYRIGNGAAGNVGADTLAHIVSNDSGIDGVRNPLPARGGIDPESIEHARQNAPSAFRSQARAVTEADYAHLAGLFPGVQRAAATFRWTGSWHTVFLTVDREQGQPVDDAFRQQLRSHFERYRMAGHDIEIDGPRYAALDLELHVCARPEYFRSVVRADLLDVFSNRDLPDGRRGFFHPDNFSFGQAVFVSHLYSAAHSIAGVESVRLVKLERQGRPGNEALQSGQLTMERLEIVRLDNDPNFPERGVLRLLVRGGK